MSVGDPGRKRDAERFRTLHVPGSPLVLYNVWDAGTARAVAGAGAPALATGSWSVAAAHGWEDGEQVPLEFALANVRRIVASVELPLTVDLESGYGATATEVGNTIAAAIEAGAVGCNLEDSEPATGALRETGQQVERLAAARRSADASGIPFFINARTDIFLLAPPEQRDLALVAAALERARRFADAGADGFFVPGLADPGLIGRVAERSPLPVNVMAATGVPPTDRLRELGVARVSHGPGPYRKLMEALGRAARAEYQRPD
jgi:2-methylisocitrate lyase-like PEP mutase family enzyme